MGAIEEVWCNDETELDVLDVTTQAMVRALAERVIQWNPDGGPGVNQAKAVLARLDDMPASVVYWCDWEGEADVEYWPTNGNTLRRATRYDRTWSCPICGRDHRQRDVHVHEMDGTV